MTLTNPNTNPNTNVPTEAAAVAADAEVAPAKPVRAKTSAMIASIADAGQKTAPAPLGHALVRLAEQNPKIVGLSADLAKYTDMHIFRDRFPECPPTRCSPRAARMTSCAWTSPNRT
jgi:hypothetical protein